MPRTYSATCDTGELTITVTITPHMNYADELELTELAQMGLVHTVRACDRNNAPSSPREVPF
jgi:hypothetical protein